MTAWEAVAGLLTVVSGDEQTAPAGTAPDRAAVVKVTVNTQQSDTLQVEAAVAFQISAGAGAMNVGHLHHHVGHHSRSKRPGGYRERMGQRLADGPAA